MKRIWTILIFFFLAACFSPDWSGNEQIIKADSRNASPYYWRYSKKEKAKAFILTPSMVYNHAGRDQFDWNKLIGESFHLSDNHKNSAIVGWRYSLKDTAVELSAYWHIDKELILVGNGRIGPVLSANIGDTISVRINRILGDSVRIWIASKKDTIQETQAFSINVDRKSRLINPWFGGNRSAPHDIFIKWAEAQ